MLTLNLDVLSPVTVTNFCAGGCTQRAKHNAPWRFVEFVWATDQARLLHRCKWDEIQGSENWYNMGPLMSEW